MKQQNWPLDIAAAESRIEIVFRNKGFLIQALTHRSYLNEGPRHRWGHNERLEYLGDAALGFIVTQYLFKHFPQEGEGVLTNLRSALVNTRTLSEVGEEIGIAEFILMSKGEREQFIQEAASRRRIMANAIEALVGAIYLDRNLGTVEIFILEYLIPKLQGIMAKMTILDPKSFLQELAQEKLRVTPRYETISREGPEHDVCWTMGVFLGERMIGQGQGKNKAEAEQEAARQALVKEFRTSSP